MIVIDASALIALLKGEPGADIVSAHVSQSLMSTINLAETLTRMVEDGGDAMSIKAILDKSPIHFIPVTEDQAIAAAQLRTPTKPYGLSLGDRMCFALAIEAGLPVLAADKIWSKLNLGVKVVLIR